METKGIPSNHMNRQITGFAKLSLKKNRLIRENEVKNLHCNSDVCIIDDSFDRLRLDLPKNIQSSQKICSPIVILDSSLDESLPKVSFDSKKSNKNEYLKTPSKMGNISFNCSKEEIDVSQPSINGWSPAQPIMCATPKQNPIPATPKDVANESFNHCSIKTIQKSQKKILSDLYGEVWKSIPTLFKTISHSKGNINECAKRLNFEDDDDKENIRFHIKKNKELYLDMENKKRDITDTEKKKKKLYTEKIPSTPEPKTLTNIKSTGKKKIVKGMSITELVEGMSNDIEVLTKKVENVSVCNKVNIGTVQVGRLSFIASLADGVQSWQCHTEAIQYKDNFKTLKEQLTRRLFKEFNSCVFNNALDHDLPIIWNSKFRCTAGTATNRSRKNANGDRIRSSSIKLSTKVVDTPQRLRDTLIHEMCHVATWLIDGELRAGHGPLWKKWAARSLKVFPELGEIKRCHSMAIHFKYTYKCTKCGYSFQRHSKSIDITKKFCGYCRGTFEIIVNKKTKDGVVSTPARRGGVNDFAQYVKENYATAKEGKTHAQVMKILGEQFSAKKNKL